MVIYFRQAENIKPPPYKPQNIAHDFLTYGLFFDGGRREPKAIIIVPPCQFYRERIVLQTITYKGFVHTYKGHSCKTSILIISNNRMVKVTYIFSAFGFP